MIGSRGSGRSRREGPHATRGPVIATSPRLPVVAATLACIPCS